MRWKWHNSPILHFIPIRNGIRLIRSKEISILHQRDSYISSCINPPQTVSLFLWYSCWSILFFLCTKKEQVPEKEGGKIRFVDLYAVRFGWGAYLSQPTLAGRFLISSCCQPEHLRRLLPQWPENAWEAEMKGCWEKEEVMGRVEKKGQERKNGMRREKTYGTPTGDAAINPGTRFSALWVSGCPLVKSNGLTDLCKTKWKRRKHS